MSKSNTIQTEITTNRKKLIECLQKVLYVPRPKFKDTIIAIICDYIREKTKADSFIIKPIIAYEGTSPVGFVNCIFNPKYHTYGREALTFGWLSYNSFEVLELLMNSVEKIAVQHRYRRIRGNINFPKPLGGIGFQTYGFDEPLLYGVAFNSPDIAYASDLEQLGYTYESKYACLRVDADNWAKGTEVNNHIEFRYYTFEQFYEIIPKIKQLAEESFYNILPDTTTGESRVYQILKAQSKLAPSNPKENINFPDYTDNQAFIEAWKNCDLSKINYTSPMAFDRRIEKLVGIILSIPNLYEQWDGGWGDGRIRVDVNTAMVHPEYKGMGIFSALNNIGQLTYTFYRPIDIEGTYVWTSSAKGINNEEAIRSIFPHCTPIRTHVVVEKKIKRSR